MPIEIDFPYSITEIFSRSTHQRMAELRKKALDVWGTKKAAAAFICRPHLSLEKVPLKMSCSSAKAHEKVIRVLTQIEHSVYI